VASRGAIIKKRLFMSVSSLPQYQVII